MDTMHAVRPPREGQNRRTHAPAEADGRALCGAASTTVSTQGNPEATTCCACRARLRDAGVLPMNSHALARRSRS